jgi:hypothetical protein
MVLAVARPWKHPKTGIYWLRKAVPEDLRPLIGKREEKRSLKTRDPAEAKRRHSEALTELDTQWANLRAGPKSLTEREANELTLTIHDQWLDRYRDNPSEQEFWRLDLGEKLWAPPPPVLCGALPDFTGSYRPLDLDSYKVQQMEGWCFNIAAQCLVARGLIVDGPSRLKVAKAAGAAIQRASETLFEYSRGNFGEKGRVGRNGGVPRMPAEELSSVKPIPFDDLVKGWAAEKRPAVKTIYEWERVVGQLTTFLGHDDASRLTAKDLIAWKGVLVEAGLRAKTIRDAKLTPIRAILQWAADNHYLPGNLAERIAIDVKTKAAETKRGFTDDEAAIILKAARSQKITVRRWVPWLCAYSGARLSEICQLRTEDVLQIEGIWCMKFDPDAGSLKTWSSERAVPLHPALIEEGFLKFVPLGAVAWSDGQPDFAEPLLASPAQDFGAALWAGDRHCRRNYRTSAQDGGRLLR